MFAKDSTDLMDPDSSKRARSTPVPGEMNASADGSRIPDTFASGGTSDAGTKYENQDLDTENAALLAKVAALSSKVLLPSHVRICILLMPKRSRTWKASS